MKQENAITQEQINNWRSEFGKVFKTTIGEDTIVWRKLNRREYVNIMTQPIDVEPGEKAYARQDIIVKTVCLYPENIEDLIEEVAGLSTGVADEIMFKSGFGAPKTEEL